jgi:hypothetical protein
MPNTVRLHRVLAATDSSDSTTSWIGSKKSPAGRGAKGVEWGDTPTCPNLLTSDRRHIRLTKSDG